MEEYKQELKELKYWDDDKLVELIEESIGFVTQGQGERFDDALNTLCKIERELTLREKN